MNHRLRFGLVALVCCAGGPLHAQTTALDTQLMMATFKVVNPGSTGTGFVVSQPDPDESKKPRMILVTAEHVLRNMKGDEATIIYRKPGADGGYEKAPIKLKVRDGGKDAWTRHPTADVAVIEIAPPPEVSVPEIQADLLATDADLGRYEVHPGDLIRCVGFPHPNQFEANGTGFGVVRLGCIASFPLLPTRKTRTFLCDLNSFEGDSGSPVALSDDHRFYDGKPQPGQVRLILGLVVGQHFIDEEFKMIYQSGKFRHRMGMAVVVHATAIREAIELLPRKPD